MEQKTSLMAQWWGKLMMLCISLFVTVVSFAQEKKIDVDINADKDGGGGFIGSPVMWIIGGAVFILLLVALLRGGRKSDA